MKKRLGKSIISIVLAIAVLVTSIPLMSWIAIAQTIVPAVLAVQDDSVAETSEDNSVSQTSENKYINVSYPISADGLTYIEDTDTKDGGLTDQEKKDYQDIYRKYLLFDAVTYYQLYKNEFNTDQFRKIDGNTITVYTYELFNHFLDNGKREGRCASPFFCIGCYLGEDSGIYKAHGGNKPDEAFNAAWHHLLNNGLVEDPRYTSPIFNAIDYRNLYNDLKNSDKDKTGELLEHFASNGHAKELRRPSNHFNYIAYFYNNNSVYHNSGVMECYRKRLIEITKKDGNNKPVSGGCHYHDRYGGTFGEENPEVVYYGYAELDDTFTATLTNLATRKNIAINDNHTAPVAVQAGNTKNEQWYFEKKTDDDLGDIYTIRLASSDQNITHDNDDNTPKYLNIESVDNNNPELTIREEPIYWRIYRNDGAYVLQPVSVKYEQVLNMSDDPSNTLSLTRFNNGEGAVTAYNDKTLNQYFIINTTYETENADSDGLPADFYACIDAFEVGGSSTWNTKVALSMGSRILRTRAVSTGCDAASDQIWHFERQSDGTYRIRNNGNGWYLDSSDSHVPVKDANGHYATDVKAYDEYKGNPHHQKWIIRKRDHGGYLIMPYATASHFNAGTVLTVSDDGSDGQNLLYNIGFSGLQQSVFDFTFVPSQPDAHTFNSDSSEFYAKISSAKVDKDNFYLKNNEITYDVEKKFIDASNEDTKKHDFNWMLHRAEDGTYFIFSTTTTNACLGYKGDKVVLGKYDDYHEAHCYLWFVYEYQGGYRLQHRTTGKYLTMEPDGSLSLEFKNTNNYDDYQLFKITETDMSIDTNAETFKMNLFNYGTRINDINDPTHVLDFVNRDNDSLDKKNLSIGAGDGVIPEMSRVLDENNYPYVKNYAYVIADGDSYTIPVQDNLTPNHQTEGSLQYLFDPESGFVKGGDDSPISEYNPVAENGDEYQSQAFKVLNPSGLFQKDGEGFYVYDSSKNSASFHIDKSSKTENDTMTGSFKVYDYLTHPLGKTPFLDKSYQGMFLPFNIAHEQGALCYGDGITESGKINYNQNVAGYPDIDKANYTLPLISRNKDNTNETGDRTKAPDLWFGMTLETDFYQTQGGKLDGNDVKFQFSGDDDVWVYLDGILALDIGNTHGKTSGEINFANSTVTGPVKTDYTNNNQEVIYSDNTKGHMWAPDSNGYQKATVSLYSQYYAAYEEVNGAQKTEVAETIARSFVTKDGAALSANKLPQPNSVQTDPVYKDYESHTLNFYYLERGSGAANCMIRLNTLSGGTTVSKEVTGLNEEVMDKAEYKFQAVYEDGTPIANSSYTLSSASIATLSDTDIATVSDETKTDKDGFFTLKANQKATFKRIPLGSNIIIREIVQDDAINTRWATYESGKEVTGGVGVQTNVITVPVDKTLDIVFTNDYEPSQNVTIHKVFDEKSATDSYKPSENQVYVIGYEILDKSDNVVVNSNISLHAGETGVIKDIPVGYSYRVWEYVPEGKLSYESPVFKKNNEEAQTKLLVAQGAQPSIDSYVEGEAKLDTNDTITITNKLIELGSMSVTFKYYNRKRVDGAPAQINSYPSSYKKTLKAEDWDDYINKETQRVNFSKLIADQGILFNGTVGVDNIIDEYVVWTSQAEAEAGFAEQTNYFADKKDGEYQTYGDTDSDELAYHTNAFGEIANDGEKWVTYYDGSTIIDPEKQGNDFDVTGITVWLFNKPKEYKATLHTIDPNNVTTAIYNSEKDILIGSDEIEFKAFYNQRIGNATGSESSEFDAETLNKYLGAYNVSDSDIVSGKKADETIVEYVDMPEIVTREEDGNSEPYTFQYWSYDEDGQFVASTSFNYAYRITNDITLYAVYGKTGLQFPGLTSFKNSIDFYYNGSGAGQVRLNTIMNPYNCPDNDETITEAAIMYVMLHGKEKYKGMSQDELLKLLLQDSGNGYGMTNLDVLREDIRRILLQEKAKAAATQKTGKVTVIDVEITASGFKYYVENSNGTDSSAINLTTKNRLQFTTEFTRDKLNGKHMLAFTAMKKNNNWIVSDNYVDYNFVNGFNFE